MLNSVKLNRIFLSDGSHLIGLPLEYGLKRILNFCDLLQGPGNPKAVLANQNEAQQTMRELLSNISRINCSTSIGRTKIRALTSCGISLDMYTSPFYEEKLLNSNIPPKKTQEQ